jgi:hypothetical protein
VLGVNGGGSNPSWRRTRVEAEREREREREREQSAEPTDVGFQVVGVCGGSKASSIPVTVYRKWAACTNDSARFILAWQNSIYLIQSQQLLN